MAHGDQVTSPWVFDTGEDYQGNHVTVTVTFDNATRVIVAPGLVAVRDPGCVYATLTFDVPGSGREKTIAIPTGTTTVRPNQLAARGFATIEDVLAVQFTVGF